MSAELMPGNAHAYYFSQRIAGQTHARALEMTLHAFGSGDRERRKEMSQRLAALEADADRQVQEMSYPAPETNGNGHAPEPADPFDAEEQKQRDRINALESKRASLSLDALTDKAKRDELTKVERLLMEVRTDLERVALARIEAARRGQAKANRERNEREQRALAEADQIGADMAKLDTEI